MMISLIINVIFVVSTYEHKIKIPLLGKNEVFLMSETIQLKNNQLGEILQDMGRVMVAFSGGVDSAVVLKRAQQELGDQVMAVVVASELFRESEFDAAVKLAEDMGVAVHKTEIKELENAHIIANNPDSWYYSKKLLIDGI